MQTFLTKPSIRIRLTLLILVLSLFALVTGCTRDRAEEVAQAPGGEVTQANLAEPEVVMIDSSTSTPTPTITPTPEPETITYRVQPGDTVSTVAEKFGTDSERIRQINLLSTDALQVGQVLRVPYVPGVTTAEGMPTPTPSPLEYEVRPGDSLLTIAVEFGVPVNDIIAANNLVNPDSLSAGQRLIIPGAQAVAAQSGGGTVSVTEERVSHVVAAGETLSTIAEQYGVTTQSVVEANRITNPDAVRVGQTLIIPVVREVVLVEHQVAAGETLSGIALRYGVTAAVILEANNLRNPDALRVGQTLVIPGAVVAADAASAPAASQSATHTVAAGETLSSIALRYGVSTQAVVDANRIANPNALRVGDVLTIPGVTQAQVEAASRVTHTVAAGETLFAIARRYGVSVDALAEANRLTNPNQLTVGQELVIPR